ncbi:hypothetical protein FXO37_22866 [Capsicum annuum]|nr:hypothetical protein FXO37_22866 [Capsicum annuum]
MAQYRQSGALVITNNGGVGGVVRNGIVSDHVSVGIRSSSTFGITQAMLLLGKIEVFVASFGFWVVESFVLQVSEFSIRSKGFLVEISATTLNLGGQSYLISVLGGSPESISGCHWIKVSFLDDNGTPRYLKGKSFRDDFVKDCAARYESMLFYSGRVGGFRNKNRAPLKQGGLLNTYTARSLSLIFLRHALNNTDGTWMGRGRVKLIIVAAGMGPVLALKYFRYTYRSSKINILQQAERMGGPILSLGNIEPQFRSLDKAVSPLSISQPKNRTSVYEPLLSDSPSATRRSFGPGAPFDFFHCSVRENQPKDLLTDEVPSFSLGLTQDEVFNLGSNVLSKEGVTIEELRSKHRNDPEKIVEIMKRKRLTKTSSPTKFQKSVKRKKSDEKGECSKIASPVASDSESEQEKVEEV